MPRPTAVRHSGHGLLRRRALESNRRLRSAARRAAVRGNNPNERPTGDSARVRASTVNPTRKRCRRGVSSTAMAVLGPERGREGPRRGQRTRVGFPPSDVLRPHPPVEGKRLVKLIHQRVGGAGEAAAPELLRSVGCFGVGLDGALLPRRQPCPARGDDWRRLDGATGGLADGATAKLRGWREGGGASSHDCISCGAKGG